MIGAVPGAVAFLVAGALVPLLVRFAVGRNLLDVPNLRSSHEVPTPRLGGVAVILGSWAGYLASGTGDGRVLLISATLVGVVGLADDLVRNLSSGIKALGQVLVAGGLVLLVPPPLVESAPGWLRLPLVLLGVLWLVALTNAFNFMDGIDGIVGGTAVVSVLFLLVLPRFAGAEAVLVGFAGATLGFLAWNVSPASIFLGDVGSHFVGFLLAATALYAPVSGGAATPLTILAYALVFLPFLFDTAYTLVRRLRVGKNVFSAHREHVYQRITPGPAMHRRTSNLYYGAAVVSGLAALLVAGGTLPSVSAGVFVAALLCMGIAALPRFLEGHGDAGG